MKMCLTLPLQGPRLIHTVRAALLLTILFHMIQQDGGMVAGYRDCMEALRDLMRHLKGKDTQRNHNRIKSQLIIE
jgi:hypothetical protein